MSCESRANKGARQAAGANGIGYEAGKSSYEAGRQAETWLYLPGQKVEQSLPWPPPGCSGRGLWGDFRSQLKAALKAWRGQKDDRALAQVRANLASALAERAVKAGRNDHPAGVAGELAEERARLLLSPPRSVTVGERVERVAVLDNAIALLRLKRAISPAQYQAALVDTVGNYRAQPARSTALVTWLPGRPVGAEAETASQVEPARKIKVRYRVVDLNEPVTSNTPAGAINPAYEQALQPRRRERAASQAQIEGMARTLAAGELLKSGASWADGPPLVGPDGMVESGNGRMLALRRAVEINPAGYEAYRQQLARQAVEFGLNRGEVEKMKQPVLVRERLTGLDERARLHFVTEANASGASRMGVAEQARADAKLIPPGFLADLQISDSDRSLADVLTKTGNAPVVSRFFKLLPETERGALADSRGKLSAEGVGRLERAMFAYALPGASGERLARLVFEAGEAIDRVGTGLKQALPQLGQIEDLIRAGQRHRDLSLGDDLAVTVEKLRDLRQQGLQVNDYLRQYKLFPELTPLQEQLLAQLDERRRSARAVAGLLNAYTGAVARTAPPNQAGMFENRLSREDLLRTAIKKVEGSWVDLRRWSAAQRAISGFDIPAPKVQRLNPAQQARGMRAAREQVCE